MIVFDAILENSTEKEALEYARGMDWSAEGSSEQHIKYHNHIGSIFGIGVYYDFGADYYFFIDESEVE
jgi:hypothetical protein